jgi:serpin B
MIELSRTCHGLPDQIRLVDGARPGAGLAAPATMRFASLTFTLAVTLAGACGGSGSGSDPDVFSARELPAAVKSDAAEIARSNNQFALDLYGQLAADPGNLFLSPFSISTALAMTGAGAAGITDQELRQTLHFTLPGDRLHGGYRALLDSLEVGRSFDVYTLATANRLFGQVGMPFLPSFLAITKDDYGAELEQVDFTTDFEAARAAVNAWVSKQTDGRIDELFKSGTIGDMTRLVLANAIVFKGNWANHFELSRTANAAFRLADGRTVQAQMMKRTGAIGMAEIPGGRLGMLPFRGKDLSMLMLLPNTADGLPALEAQLTSDALAGAIARAGSAAAAPNFQNIEIALPRFGITSKLDLPAALIKLGMVTAFDPDTADFSGIAGDRHLYPLYIESVVHEATITVDETGADAAAATGVGVGIVSAPLPFVADRPFVFAIFDHVTGSILFLGRVQDPTT